MVDPLHSTAAADECLADDVLFFHPGDIPFLDTLEGLRDVEEVSDEEEGEELEWISNKDAIPMLESPFEYAGGGGGGVVQVAAAYGAPPRGPRSKRPRRGRSVVKHVLRPEEAAAERRKRSTARDGNELRRCWHCAAEETPQWRAGPDGPKTLCNACGVRYKSGRLLPEYRPAASPTFTPALHSNSHRRILEMRRRGAGGAAALTAD